MSLPLYINEDNDVFWDRARLASTSAYVNSGSGSYALLDDDGNSIDTGSLAYVTGTHGRWFAAIDKADVAGLTEGATYWLELTLSNGTGADGFRRVECEAQYHGEAP